MSKVYFMSDPHFGHKNLAKYRGMTSDESDKLIISNWNNLITKNDIVYLLGDITMEYHQAVRYYMSQLKGIIRVIPGNHDFRQTCQILQDMGILVMGCLEYKGFICTHIPIHPMELEGFYRGNIHGHIHDPKIDYGKKYINVTCERINYTPVEFDKLVEIFINKQLNNE